MTAKLICTSGRASVFKPASPTPAPDAIKRPILGRQTESQTSQKQLTKCPCIKQARQALPYFASPMRLKDGSQRWWNVCTSPGDRSPIENASTWAVRFSDAAKKRPNRTKTGKFPRWMTAQNYPA